MTPEKLFELQREKMSYLYAGIEQAERFLSERGNHVANLDEDIVLDLYRDFLLSQDLCDDIEL